ncbi:exosortase [Marinimicrobium sp. C2-29]|uniref:exosortase n=1 Tax=Marinimicrobium sp. C2-29 TaxID=3139825 RepID=UPI00313A0AA1
MEVEHSAHGTSSSLWRPLHQYLPLFLLAVWVLLYWPTFEGLYARWVKWDEGMAHGLPVAILFVYLLYKSLPWTPLPTRNATWWVSVVGLALGSAAWYVFYAVNVTILEQLILLPLLVLLLAAVFGLKQVFHHRLLLLFPLFAIPVWDYLNDPLLAMSSFVVGEMVRLAGMPALIKGNSIFIPHGHILIADGCSGLRYFVIALTMGYLISYLNRYSERQLLAVLAVAAIFGLITNWIRIFVLIVIGYQTEMQSPLMSDHEYFGWGLFALICLPAIYYAPVVKREETAGMTALSPTKGLSVRALVPVLALALGPIASMAVELEPEATPWRSSLANQGVAQVARDMPSPLQVPDGGQSEAALLNTSGVYIQVDEYQRTSSAEKLVPPMVRLYNSDSWTQEQQWDDRVAGQAAKVSILLHKAGGRRVAQVQWFEVGGYVATSIPQAKLWQIPAVLQGRNNFRIVTLQAPCLETDCSEAITNLKQAAEGLELRETH